MSISLTLFATNLCNCLFIWTGFRRRLWALRNGLLLPVRRLLRFGNLPSEVSSLKEPMCCWTLVSHCVNALNVLNTVTTTVTALPIPVVNVIATSSDCLTQSAVECGPLSGHRRRTDVVVCCYARVCVWTWWFHVTCKLVYCCACSFVEVADVMWPCCPTTSSSATKTGFFVYSGANVFQQRKTPLKLRPYGT